MKTISNFSAKSLGRDITIELFGLLLALTSASLLAAEANESIDQRISRARISREAVVWVGETPPPERESQKLWEAMKVFQSEGPTSGVFALEAFLRSYTNSLWVPSLRSVLAKYYRERGQYTPALEHWQSAWTATKHAESGAARQVADFTLVHWTRLLASLGRVETLKYLFDEAGGRTMDAGPLLQQFLSTREGFATMAANPRVSYRCGTFALHSVAGVLKPGNDCSVLLLVDSPSNGFSVAELTRLSAQNGLGLVPVRREAGDELIVPCVVHWKQNHYAAITQQRGNSLYVMDPTFGHGQWLTKQTVNSEASGVFLIPGNRVPQGWSEIAGKEAESIFGKGYPSGIDDDDDEPCEKCPCPPGHGGGGGSGGGRGGRGGGGSGCTFCPGRSSGNDDLHGHHGAGGGAKASGGGGFEHAFGHVTDRPTGMPRWRVSEPYVTLWVEDEPLGYQPARGDRVSFKLGYKQRDQVVRDTNWFSVGKLWNSLWLSHVEQKIAGGSGIGYEVLFVPGGGKRVYLASGWGPAVEPNSNTRFERMTNGGGTLLGFKVLHASGAMDLYTHFVLVGGTTNAFLTANVSASGHTNRFEYTNHTSGAVQLLRVIDAQNQTNWVYYATNHPYSSNLIARVVDAFGREARMDYHTNGWMTNITDVAGISSSLLYDTNGWMTNMTTPYGPTTFQLNFATDDMVSGTNNRTALITHPNGSKELYVYRAYSSWLTNSYPDSPTNDLADTFLSTIVSAGHRYRNSFHWNQQQFAALPENAKTNFSNLSGNDFRMARLRHWLHKKGDATKISHALAIEQQPSPTLNPIVDGQRTWYGYDGQMTVFAGDTLLPNIIAQKPNNDPNAATRFTYNEYRRYQDFMLTNVITSYALADGTRALRTNKFVYAATDVDLLQVIGPTGGTEMQYSYNANHQVIGETNALGYWTTYAYNGNGQVTNMSRSSGLTTTYAYDANGYLTNSAHVKIGRSESFTYTNGLVHTHTDALGLNTTNTWDALQRLTSVSDARGYISNVYTKLDLTATRDQLGNWKYFTYDSLQQLTSKTNELGHATTYSYCDCGALGSTADALGNITTFYYDFNGRLTNAIYPGNLSVTNTYNLLGELISVRDSAGNSTTNWYNHQGLVVAVSNAFGRVRSITYDIEDRPLIVTDANGVTVTSTLDDVGRILSRTYPDGGVEKFQYSAHGLIGYTNQLGFVTKYTYDEAGRKVAETNSISEVTQFKYDASGNLTNLIDGKSQNTFWKYDQFGKMTNKVDHTGADMFRYGYDANGRLTNRWSPAKLNTYYAYDAAGNLTNVDYNVSTDLRCAYDALNRLTNMVDAAGTTKYGYTGFGAVLGEDGPWENDTVSYGYDSGLRRNSLSLAQPNASAWAHSYAHDAMGRLSSITSPAGDFTYSYTAAGSLVKTVTLPPWVEIVNTHNSVGRQTETRMRDVFSLVPLSTNYFVYDQAGRRTTNARNHHVWTHYAYDDAGQLRNAVAYQTNITLRSHERFGYQYDAAGNLAFRTNSAMTRAFTVNSLNQLTNSTRSGNLTIVGNHNGAATNVTVSHNGLGATNMALWPDHSFVRGGYILPDGTNTFVAVAKDALLRFDTNTSVVFAPVANSFAYDANGNLTWDGQKALEYDDENQLTRIIATNFFKSEFTYDGKLRRRVRREFTWQNGAWVQTNEVRYVYDGNLVLQERDNFNIPSVSYTRGTDLSGTLEEAGGIGGLLARTDHSIYSLQPSEAHAYYHCDANGNVMAMIDAHQNVVARYAYEPFGRAFYMSGSLAEANVYRFSSKETDPASGLVYYLYRYYDSTMQRWVNRDPIHEAGGWNLYGFVQNNPVSHYDPFGLIRGSGPDPYCKGKCAKQLFTDMIGCSLYAIAGGAIFVLLPPTGPIAGYLMGLAATCAVLSAARYALCIRSCVLTSQCPFPIGPYPGSWPWKMP